MARYESAIKVFRENRRIAFICSLSDKSASSSSFAMAAVRRCGEVSIAGSPEGSTNVSASASMAPATENMASLPERPLCERLMLRPCVCLRFALGKANGVVSAAERLRAMFFAGVTNVSYNKSIKM
jgi:hypothetical protein